MSFIESFAKLTPAERQKLLDDLQRAQRGCFLDKLRGQRATININSPNLTIIDGPEKDEDNMAYSGPRRKRPKGTRTIDTRNIGQTNKPIIIVQKHRLVWQSPYNASAVNDLKDKIPFEERTWDPTHKVWHISATRQNMQRLKDLAVHFYGTEAFIIAQEDPEKVLENSIDQTSFYTILEVSETATAQEIKSASRKKIIKHHPDKGGTGTHFIIVQDAYKVLSDPKKRRRYDIARKMLYRQNNNVSPSYTT